MALLKDYGFRDSAFRCPRVFFRALRFRAFVAAECFRHLVLGCSFTSFKAFGLGFRV